MGQIMEPGGGDFQNKNKKRYTLYHYFLSSWEKILGQVEKNVLNPPTTGLTFEPFDRF